MFFSRPLHFTIDSSKPDASYHLSKEINMLFKNNMSEMNTPVILCVGTDRSTGDCLGPLVGDKLTKNYILKNIQVYGTLKEPVHAKNLNEYINNIYQTINNPFIIAIDASLGKSENIGNINLFKGPLFPGAGVNKSLKPVGDVSITGIVNVSGFMEYIVLQNTRLSLVMQMADIISLSLYISLRKILSSQAIAY